MVRQDPDRDLLEEELRWLRRQPGNFKERLSGTGFLVATVGGGSQTRTAQELERVRRRHWPDRDGDIRAYFAVCGYGLTGENLDERLRSYAKGYGVVVRTALRRSDRGAKKIAALLRDGLPYQRPFAYVVLRQDGASAYLHVGFRHSPHSRVTEPAIYVNGSRQAVAPVASNDEEMEQDVLTFQFPAIPLDPTVAADEPLAQVQLAWAPPVAPIWELVGNLADARLMTRFTVVPPLSIYLELRWWDDDAAESQDVELAPIG